MTTSLALKLARRELRGGARGFGTFLACLALGVAAIAGIGSLSSSVVSGLEADAQSLLGGDVSIRTVHRPVSPQTLAWLRRHGTVSRRVSLRTMVRGAAGKRRSLIELKAVDGAYPLYGRLGLTPRLGVREALGFGDGVWGAAAEPGLMARLGLQTGDHLRVGDIRYQIRAVVTREPDRTGGLRALALGPHLIVAEQSLAATGLIQPGSLVRYYYRLRLDGGTGLAAFRRALRAEYPDTGWRVRDRTNAVPSIRRFIDRTALFLTLVGLTALLMGGVGIGNSVKSFLDTRTRIIATLKCLGAPRRLIFQTYFTQIAAMALAAIAIGLAIGGLAPLIASRLLSDALPVAARIGVYPGPLLLAAAFGVLTTFVFALGPLARACDIAPGSLFRDLIAPVHARQRFSVLAMTSLAVTALAALAVAAAPEARLALWFVAGTLAAFVIFHAAGKGIAQLAGKLPPARSVRVRLALANLYRPGAPTAGIVLSLGLGLTVLVTVALIEGNLARQIRETMPERAPAFYFIDIQPAQARLFEAAVRAVKGVDEVQRVPMLRGRITAINGTPAASAKVDADVAWVLRSDRGLTWSATMPDGARLTAGEWWPADYRGPPLLSFGAQAARGFGIGIGDTLTLDILGRPITATIANLRDIEWRSLRLNFVIVLSPGVIEKAPQTHIATVHAAPDAEAAVEKVVADDFANVSAIRVREVLQTASEMLDRIAAAVSVMAAITVLAGALVLGGAIAAGHRRRVYEAVVLKVLGATRRDVLAGYLVEYLFLGVATAALAAVLGTIAAWLVLTEVMHAGWVFLPATVAATALAAVGFVLAAGFWGTWRALGHKAAPWLRNE
jgi:putative ABC transport system permease protein